MIQSILCLGLLLVASAWADVSLINGNFFISYTDLSFKGGADFSPELERVYNSKSNYIGLFGQGWGSKYETRLVLQGQDATVHEMGNGKEVHFKKGKGPGREALVATAEGYARKTNEGWTQNFTKAGQLLSVREASGRSVSFSYSNGRLTEVLDHLGRRAQLSYDGQGRVAQVAIDGGAKTTYRYGTQGELVENIDDAGDKFIYRYSADGLLASVTYSDGRQLEVTYLSRDEGGDVRSVRKPNGTTLEYATTRDPKDPGHKAVVASTRDAKGSILGKEEHEFYKKLRPDGTSWVVKHVSRFEGVTTETTYNECCGLPTRITRLSAQSSAPATTFDYDNAGRLTRKDSRTETTTIKYDGQFGKVARVERKPKTERKPASTRSSWVSFKYDAQGNLAGGESSDGRSFVLVHDVHGRIHAYADRGGRRVSLNYNEESRPSDISVAGSGAMDVEYDRAGKMKSVKGSLLRKTVPEAKIAYKTVADLVRQARVGYSY